MEMMRRADRRAVAPPVVTAAGAKKDVMVVKIPPTAAGRHRAAPTVAREDGVAMRGLRLPVGDDAAEHALERPPARLTVDGEEVEPIAKQGHHRRRSEEANLAVGDLDCRVAILRPRPGRLAT